MPQESLLEGKLFHLFTDVILEAFEKGNIGCKIDGIFACALAYVDDLVLLCPSLLGIQTMLDTCIRVAYQFGLVFSSTKSSCGFFG